MKAKGLRDQKLNEICSSRLPRVATVRNKVVEAHTVLKHAPWRLRQANGLNQIKSCHGYHESNPK